MYRRLRVWGAEQGGTARWPWVVLEWPVAPPAAATPRAQAAACARGVAAGAGARATRDVVGTKGEWKLGDTLEFFLVVGQFQLPSSAQF